MAGHAWVFAPPFTVVDISVKQQTFGKKERIYLPDTVLSTETRHAHVDADDIVSPAARMEMSANGVPSDQHLFVVTRLIPDILSAFPPIAEPGLLGATLKYSPVAIHAPDGSLEQMRCMTFDKLTPFEIYTSKVRAALRADV